MLTSEKSQVILPEIRKLFNFRKHEGMLFTADNGFEKLVLSSVIPGQNIPSIVLGNTSERNGFETYEQIRSMVRDHEIFPDPSVFCGHLLELVYRPDEALSYGLDISGRSNFFIVRCADNMEFIIDAHRYLGSPWNLIANSPTKSVLASDFKIFTFSDIDLAV